MIGKYRKRTGIIHLTCHALRHTFGHDLIAAGVDIQQEAIFMGHFKEDGSSNIEMTMIYTTTRDGDMEEAVERISWT